MFERIALVLFIVSLSFNVAATQPAPIHTQTTWYNADESEEKEKRIRRQTTDRTEAEKPVKERVRRQSGERVASEKLTKQRIKRQSAENR